MLGQTLGQLLLWSPAIPLIREGVGLRLVDQPLALAHAPHRMQVLGQEKKTEVEDHEEDIEQQTRFRVRERIQLAVGAET
nr:uncharacterized protein CTRU02_14289 [Colletotrichum truncatum]KAF6782396.1 hypothetical protein CTRU02_14289 [Colletotrichum truncatum]